MDAGKPIQGYGAGPNSWTRHGGHNHHASVSRRSSMSKYRRHRLHVRSLPLDPPGSDRPLPGGGLFTASAGWPVIDEITGASKGRAQQRKAGPSAEEHTLGG